MTKQYSSARPDVPAMIRREAEIEAGHKCSIAHCDEHTYLDLHHIDGNRENNVIENLILLCTKHHRMAESNKIDRKSLNEYKRINREKAGLTNKLQLTEDQLNLYTSNLRIWIASEIYRVETSPILKDKEPIHVQTALKIDNQIVSKDVLFERIQNLLSKQHCVLVLGNGGSGKTTLLLNWIKLILDNEYLSKKLPIYIPLSSLTPKSDLPSLIRSSLGKNGIGITIEELEGLLLQGNLLIFLDGVNEINVKAVAEGAVDDIFSFISSYPLTHFVVSSRYVELIRDKNVPVIEMLAWERQDIQTYLHSRLGMELGEQTFTNLGDELDFEWLQGNSVAGFCSNPLTLWMLATSVEGNGHPPTQNDDLTDEIVDLMLRRTSEQQRNRLPITLLKDILAKFAYFMLNHDDILSTSVDRAIEIIHEIILQNKESKIPVPKGIDAYDVLNTLVTTGLLRQEGERIEWLHQILQEHLSMRYSTQHFANFMKICDLILCPYCNYSADECFERDGKLIGMCYDAEIEYVIQLPIIPKHRILRRKLKLIDRTDLPHDRDMIAIPHSFYREGYTSRLPLSGMVYLNLLGEVQNNQQGTLIDRHELQKQVAGEAKVQFDLEVWALVEAGILNLRHKNHVTTVYINTPSVNPSLRDYSYVLVTLRHMSFEELEEEPEERFGVTSEDKEEYLAERRRKNLPIEHSYPFNDDKKEKVFKLARKYGGKILRTWGPYTEVITEFSGEAWDFSKFNTEE